MTWLPSWKNPSSSQYFNWINQLSEFDFDISHRQGVNHANADAVSRLNDCKQCPFGHLVQAKTRKQINRRTTK